MVIGKKIFIDELALRCDITKVEATKVYNNVFGVLHQLITEGNEEVSIPEIGKFKIKTRDERKAHNPSTGEQVIVPSKKVVNFKVSSVIKEAVAQL